MTHSPLATWADKSPGRWILIWCVILGLWIVGSSVSFSDETKAAPAVKQPVKLDPIQEMQQQVGPEGVCDAKGCRDKRGRKVKLVQGVKP